MAVEYRQLSEGELDGAISVWMDAWPDVNPRRARRVITTDPMYQEHIFNASGAYSWQMDEF